MHKNQDPDLSYQMNKAVFLDRDGVINPDPGYIDDPSLLIPFPFAAKAIKILNKLKYKVIVVTNQSGIARGYFSFRDVENIHEHLCNTLGKESAVIDRVYFSPYLADGEIEPWNIQHEDRKPGIGMFKKAAIEFNIDPENSYMIGDRLTDMIFAHQAGLTPILVLTGDGKEDFLNRLPYNPDHQPSYIAQDLLAAALTIKTLEARNEF